MKKISSVFPKWDPLSKITGIALESYQVDGYYIESKIQPFLSNNGLLMAQFDISILGQRYKIGCPEGEEDVLNESAKEFNGQLLKMKEANPSSRNEQLIVIAALNFCHQLKTEKHKNVQHDTEINQRIKSLQTSIEALLTLADKSN